MTEIDYRALLDTPVEGESGARTIRGYFVRMSEAAEEMKRPFGESSAEYEVYEALVRAGAVPGEIDPEEGWLNSLDNEAARRAYAGLRKAWAAEAGDRPEPSTDG